MAEAYLLWSWWSQSFKAPHWHSHFQCEFRNVITWYMGGICHTATFVAGKFNSPQLMLKWGLWTSCLPINNLLLQDSSQSRPTSGYLPSPSLKSELPWTFHFISFTCIEFLANRYKIITFMTSTPSQGQLGFKTNHLGWMGPLIFSLLATRIYKTKKKQSMLLY